MMGSASFAGVGDSYNLNEKRQGVEKV